MRELFRDRSRDQLSKALNVLGIKADMAARGRPEEKIRSDVIDGSIGGLVSADILAQLLAIFGTGSLGIIDIRDNPIRWINVVRLKRGNRTNRGSLSRPRYRMVFGIPDERRAVKRRPVAIRSVRRRTFPWFGRVLGAVWTGEDYGMGIVDMLSHDYTVNDFVKTLGNVQIHDHFGEFIGWTLEVDELIIPTSEQWDLFGKIIDYLLSSCCDS